MVESVFLITEMAIGFKLVVKDFTFNDIETAHANCYCTEMKNTRFKEASNQNINKEDRKPNTADTKTVHLNSPI